MRPRSRQAPIHRLSPALALLVLLLAAAAPAAAAELPLRPAGAKSNLGNERLSDEFSITRYARPFRLDPVRAAARPGARVIARLRFQTEDGPPEVYLVLRSKVDSKDRVWLQIRVPTRPNGTTGWVRRDAMGPLRTVRTHLRINRTTLTATLFKRGKKVWSSRVGVGAPSTPTPAGRFWIRERLRNLGGSGVYGPWAFGTAAYSRLSDWPGGGVIGVHGTNEPQKIPGRPSHGCIRVPNHKIVQLAKLMSVGTSVQIL